MCLVAPYQVEPPPSFPKQEATGDDRFFSRLQGKNPQSFSFFFGVVVGEICFLFFICCAWCAASAKDTPSKQQVRKKKKKKKKSAERRLPLTEVGSRKRPKSIVSDEEDNTSQGKCACFLTFL